MRRNGKGSGFFLTDQISFLDKELERKRPVLKFLTSQLILNNKNPIKHNNNKNQFKCWHQTRENFATKLNKDLGNGCFKEKLFKGKDVKYFWTFRNAYFSKNGLNTKETVFWFRNFKII